jgi:hypothetical protein
MAAVDKSLYEELFIESTDKSKTVDIKLGTVSIDYFEDIFSPTITARIAVVNTGDSINNQSIYNGLPLRGGERVSMKIKGNSDKNPGLDFSTSPKDYLYVSSISNVMSDTNNESFILHLVSREAITNETARVPKKYQTSNTIDVSAQSIIDEYLKTEKPVVADKASNTYGFIGNLRKPFTVLIWLAAKAIPDSSGDATAGFVFYQTKDGFYFRSIDKMIAESPKATYTFTQVNQSAIERDNDFNILSYTTTRNQNLLEKLRLGTYASYRTFYNVLDFTFTPPDEGLFKLEDYAGKAENLGSPFGSEDLPKISEGVSGNLGDLPTRIITQVLDIGTMDPEVTQEDNSNPIKYQSQAIMRYNLLFTQTLNMTVPSNTNLRAGDIIECKFPKISRSQSREFDDDQSGLYMIKELCHHFDTDGSYTSMKLIRDTFGKKL